MAIAKVKVPVSFTLKTDNSNMLKEFHGITAMINSISEVLDNDRFNVTTIPSSDALNKGLLTYVHDKATKTLVVLLDGQLLTTFDLN